MNYHSPWPIFLSAGLVSWILAGYSAFTFDDKVKLLTAFVLFIWPPAVLAIDWIARRYRAGSCEED